MMFLVIDVNESDSCCQCSPGGWWNWNPEQQVGPGSRPKKNSDIRILGYHDSSISFPTLRIPSTNSRRVLSAFLRLLVIPALVTVYRGLHIILLSHFPFNGVKGASGLTA